MCTESVQAELECCGFRALRRLRPGFGCTGSSDSHRGRCTTDTAVCFRVKLGSSVVILASSKRRKSAKSTSSRVRDVFMNRKQPNILVTGTPGTGKTTTCQQVIEAIGFTHINVGDWVKQHELHSGWDEQHGCYIIDEDKVCDALEDVLAAGGTVVDYHGCDFFPERWFDLVIVLQTDNSLLYERLEKRGYPQKKITENVECEIMQVIVDEAQEAYKEEIVQVLPSNSVEDMDSNVERIVAWARQVCSQ